MAEISVIIPVYNTFEYLDNSIGSIMNQSFKDLEIICIDNGSTDNSLEKLNELAQKDSRIQVLHIDENTGPGGATNLGLDKATGKYVYFMDSDDILDLNALQECYEIMEEKNLDLIIFPAIEYDIDSGEYFKDPYTAMTEFSEYICDDVFDWRDIGNKIFKISVTPWSKLYKHEIIRKNDLRFIANIHFQDNPFFWEVLFNCNRIYFYKKFLYKRIVRQDSCTHSYEEQNIDTIKINNIMTQIFMDYNHFDEFKEIMYNRKVDIVHYRYRLINDRIKELFFTEMKKDFVKILGHEKYEEFYSSLALTTKRHFDNVISSSNHVEYDLRNEYDTLLDKKKMLENDVNNEKNKNYRLNSKNKELNDLNKSLLSSRSWKITKPLRSFRNMFKK